MDNGIVPNPKREVRINFNIEAVKSAIKTLPEFVKPTALKIANDTMNFYQFEAPAKGIFSMGMFLEICVQEISPTHTLIQFECRRVIGAIDGTHEITETYNFINGCISMLGKALKGELK